MALFEKLEKPTESPKMFGAYVVSCSASLGWGGQGGTLSFSLVEDPRPPIPNPGFDPTAVVSDTNPITMPDPEEAILDLPAIGTACFFQYYNFYFGGIFQRWEYKESSSGKLYDVVLESPSKLLDGIQVILDEFQGTAYGRLTPTSSYNEDLQFVPYLGYIFANDLDNVWNPFGN